MKASDVTRITVQVHYPRFGEEVEENIHVSPAKNESILSHRILMDRDARGYAYRLMSTTQREGKLVLPWQREGGRQLRLCGDPRGPAERGFARARGSEGGRTGDGGQLEGEGAGEVQRRPWRSAMNSSICSLRR